MRYFKFVGIRLSIYLSILLLVGCASTTYKPELPKWKEVPDLAPLPIDGEWKSSGTSFVYFDKGKGKCSNCDSLKQRVTFKNIKRVGAGKYTLEKAIWSNKRRVTYFTPAELQLISPGQADIKFIEKKYQKLNLSLTNPKITNQDMYAKEWEQIQEIEWNEILKADSIELYEKYIDESPNSKYSSIAKSKVEYARTLNDSLLKAVKMANLRSARQLIEDGAEVNNDDVVHAAIQTGKAPVVELLLNMGPESLPSKLLAKAAFENNFEMVSFLKKHGASLKSSSGVSFRAFREDTKSGKTTDLTNNHNLKVEKLCNKTIRAALPEYMIIENIVMGHATNMKLNFDEEGALLPTGSYPIFVVYEIVRANVKTKGQETFLAKCLMNDKAGKGHISEASVLLCPPNPKHKCLPKTN